MPGCPERLSLQNCLLYYHPNASEVMNEWIEIYSHREAQPCPTLSTTKLNAITTTSSSDNATTSETNLYDV